jgi:hypothetical protein
LGNVLAMLGHPVVERYIERFLELLI